MLLPAAHALQIEPAFACPFASAVASLSAHALEWTHKLMPRLKHYLSAPVFLPISTCLCIPAILPQCQSTTHKQQFQLQAVYFVTAPLTSLARPV